MCYYIIYNDSIIFKPFDEEIIFPGSNLENKVFSADFNLESNGPIKFENNIDLICYYNIIGLEDEIRQTRIIYKNDSVFGMNPTTMSRNFLSLKFPIVNDEEKKIVIPKGSYTLNHIYIIPPQYVVNCEEGVTLDFKENGGLISYSALNFVGTTENPIYITSSDSSGQGLCVINVDDNSIIDYVMFNNLSNFDINQWTLTGAITFYESNVLISNCVFSDNRVGDDLLNIVNSQFEIRESRFLNSHADAFDSDFCQGSITNCSFTNCGNDGIDISGTDLNLNNIVLSNVKDKGISAGERSQIVADSITITDSEIAVCSKDSSTINISHYKLQHNTIGFTAFMKKTEFGPSKIIGIEGINDLTDIPYLVEINSVCIIDGVKIASFGSGPHAIKMPKSVRITNRFISLMVLRGNTNLV